MRDAAEESVGLDEVRRIVVNSYHFDQEAQIVDEIIRFIYTAINETQGCEEISRRYQDYWLDMNAW